MEHKKIEVDGVEYIVIQPDPEIAFEIGIELTQIIGESIGQFMSGGAEAAPQAVRALLAKLDPKKSYALIERILSTTEAQAEKKVMLDRAGIKAHFRGKTGQMVKVVAAVLQYTHSDFFDAIRESIAEAMQKVTAKL